MLEKYATKPCNKIIESKNIIIIKIFFGNKKSLNFIPLWINEYTKIINAVITNAIPEDNPEADKNAGKRTIHEIETINTFKYFNERVVPIIITINRAW